VSWNAVISINVQNLIGILLIRLEGAALGSAQMRPFTLPPNVLRHFYAGGERIAALRGTPPADHSPEEWIGAVNTTFDGSRGLSALPDGRLVRDAIEANPEAFLGPEHVARFGSDPALLVKLLDAGQRLPVHFHPDGEFAARELGLAHGKTEAWLIVEAEPGASVWVGFAREAGLDELRSWMARQDSAAMLAAMRELPVRAGDAIFVPAGVPHAIGAEILIVEVQEPTDLSVLLEWEGFELTEDDGHLGLGWEVALTALDRSASDDERTAALRGPGAGRSLLPAAADPWFRAERVRGGDELDAGFSILVGLAGSGELGGVALARGTALLVPHASGPLTVSGDLEAIRCRPPAP
jgi:mannose-6-phosphate isomerase